MQGRPTLPRTARDLFGLTPASLVYRAVSAFAEVTGVWERPMRCRGDLEEMRLLDKIYWFYKAARPVRRARRGSGLEAYFADRTGARAELPAGFLIQSELTLSAVGDLMSHVYLARSKDTLYAQVLDLVFGADVSMANLECVVEPPAAPALAMSFDEPPALHYDAAAFAAASAPSGRKYRLLAAANNHSLDFGEVGVESTLRRLREAGIAVAGLTPRDGDPSRATVLDERGFRLGVVSWTFGLNARRPPADRPHIVHRTRLNDGVAAADLALLTRQIEHARGAGVDFLIAHLHWGLEHELYPIPEQLELAHHLAELGIDAIVGHHPHVLQPMELYRTKRDPHRLVPIYYSLGNLINPFSAPDSCRSGVARITLAKGVAAGEEVERVYVRDAELAAVEQRLDRERERIWLEPTGPQPSAAQRERAND